MSGPLAASAIAIMATLTAAGFQANGHLVDPPDRANACRNGWFPSMSETYSLARLDAPVGLMADDRMGDNGHWDANSCPGDAGPCRVSAPVAAGTPVLVASHFNGFSCVYVPPSGEAGWIPDNRLSPLPARGAGWAGRWRYGDDGLDIRPAGGGAFRVTGHAVWHGGHGNDHTGDIDFTAQPVETRLISPEGDTCRAELIKLGAYLVVRDNGNCGGANVRLNGVYERR